MALLLPGNASCQEKSVTPKLLPPQHPKFEVPVQDLRVTSTTSTQVPTSNFFGFAQCDKDGRFYLHTARGFNFNNMEVQRLKITADEGEIISYLAPTTFTVDKKGFFINFSVTPAGDLWMLGESINREYFLFKFDSDGKPTSQTHLDVPDHLDLATLAVSDQQVILLAGNYNREANADIRGKRYVALFDSAGKQLKEFDAKTEKVNLEAIPTTESVAIFGEDGLLYLLLPQSILVVSPGGTLEKRIPFENSKDFSAKHLSVSGGYLAVWMTKAAKDGPDDVQFLIINADNGESLVKYNTTEETGNAPLCFSRIDGFTMWRMENKRIEVLTANGH